MEDLQKLYIMQHWEVRRWEMEKTDGREMQRVHVKIWHPLIKVPGGRWSLGKRSY